MRMIDVTGIPLLPGNKGKDCLGNGRHLAQNGEYIECCCDECDYGLCCYEMKEFEDCPTCPIKECPRAGKSDPAHI